MYERINIRPFMIKNKDEMYEHVNLIWLMIIIVKKRCVL
jgi:hypothetical protein